MIDFDKDGVAFQGLLKGVPLTILVDSFEGYEEGSEEVLQLQHLSLSVGGVCAFNVTGFDNALVFRNAVVSGVKASAFANMEPNPGSYICIACEMLEGFTLSEKKAILAHELGHIFLGHTTEIAHQEGLVCNLGWELAADAYAVSQTSIDDVRESLWKLRSNIAQCASKWKGYDYLEAVNILHNEPVLKARFAALIED